MKCQRYCTDIMIPLLGAKESSFFAMFKAFLDESGMDKNISVVIAGIVGRKEECDWAAERWNDALKKAGVKVPFHSIEFWNRNDGRMHGAYEHLSIPDADLLAGLLTDIVTSHPLVPIGITVDVDAFMNLTEDERRWLTTNKRFGRDWNSQGSPKNPYFFAFQACTQIAAKETPLDDKVYFTFDRQDDFADRARRLYNETLAINNAMTRKMADPIVFTSKESSILLQAADFVAYLSRWYAENARSMSAVAYKSFKRMAEPEDSKIYLITLENMDAVLQRCPFRQTFWEGLTKPDFIEQMRMIGHNVVAFKLLDEYRAHHIRQDKVRIIGKLERIEKEDGTSGFAIVKSQDEDRGS